MNQIFVEKCENYGAGLESALNALLSRLGGMGSVVKSGQKVLIKPNMLTDSAPEKYVTTHPELVRYIARAVKAAGGRPFIGDSPAGVVDVERMWDVTGFGKICREENVPLLNFTKEKSRRFDVDGVSFNMVLPVLEFDVVINVPKLKTHVLTVLTNAVKNMYGCVPGMQKAMLHRMFPRPDEFGRVIAAVYRQAPPVLTVCDAVYGMQGNGPSAGVPAHLGFLAASRNGIALDFAMCKLLGIPSKAVSYLSLLRHAGVHGNVPDNSICEISGDIPDGADMKNFSKPSTFYTRLIPGWIIRKLARFTWTRPHFTEACVGCGLCAESCPADAIVMSDSGRPELTSNACVECCCCHEVCPEKAVDMQDSPLLKFISRLRRG